MHTFNGYPPTRKFRQDALDDNNGDDDIEDSTNLDNGSDPTGSGTKHLSELADIIVEASENNLTRPEALRWLLHTRLGRTTTAAFKRHGRRLFPALQKETNMTKQIQDYDAVSIAKVMVEDNRSYSVSEHQLTEAI